MTEGIVAFILMWQTVTMSGVYSNPPKVVAEFSSRDRCEAAGKALVGTPMGNLLKERYTCLQK